MTGNNFRLEMSYEKPTLDSFIEDLQNIRAMLKNDIPVAFEGVDKIGVHLQIKIKKLKEEIEIPKGSTLEHVVLQHSHDSGL
jgi:hypothetical protein